VFLESIKNPCTFERAAARALAAGKPIIAAKIGRSEAGARASLSHTGAVTGDHADTQAMFRRHGIIEATDIDEMVELAAAFSLHRERLPAGTRVGIGTASGGGGGWLADACVAAGLTVPVLDPVTRALLDERIPIYGSSQNPVDATAQVIVQSGYSELTGLIASSSEVDAVIMIVSARSAASFENDRDKLAAVARTSPVPIVLWSYTLPSADTVRIVSQAGYPLFTSMQSCARAVAAMAHYRAVRERQVG
jgi:acyl-CoA synthetase (NDP forming)